MGCAVSLLLPSQEQTVLTEKAGGQDIAVAEHVKVAVFFWGWLCAAPVSSGLGNCCHLQVPQILRRKCVKPRVPCRGWKWRQATHMKNDGSFKRQLSHFQPATLTTMRRLTVFPSVFLLFSSFLPASIYLRLVRKDLWERRGESEEESEALKVCEKIICSPLKPLQGWKCYWCM